MSPEMIVALLNLADGRNAAPVILALTLYIIVRKGIRITVEPFNAKKPRKRGNPTRGSEDR